MGKSSNLIAKSKQDQNLEKEKLARLKAFPKKMYKTQANDHRDRFTNDNYDKPGSSTASKMRSGRVSSTLLKEQDAQRMRSEYVHAGEVEEALNEMIPLG